MISKKKRIEELEKRVGDLEEVFARFLVARTMEQLERAMQDDKPKKAKKGEKTKKVKEEVKKEPKKRGRKPKKVKE